MKKKEGAKFGMKRILNEGNELIANVLYRHSISLFLTGFPQASQKQLFNYYISWLLVTTKRTDAIIDRFLRILNIGIDSDVVVATSPMSTSQATNATLQYLNR